ncbi:hypothetical protein AHF37_05362 [Paragonimus kellicotti]|nr:hypothetical protein AHF37_05362 [Paragonimus kellicotti]
MLGPLYSSFFRCYLVPKFAIKTLSNLGGLFSLGCCMCSDSSAKTDPPSVLSHVADHILKHNVRRILVLAGAGISTDSGIPDFRWVVLRGRDVFCVQFHVHPFAGVAEEVPDSVPRVLFNRDLVGSFRYQKRHQDLVILGPISNSIMRLARLLDWADELEELITRCEPNTPSKPKKPTSKSKSCPTVSTSNNHSRSFSTIAKMLTPTRLASRFRALSVATVAPAPHSPRCPITMTSTAECVPFDAVAKTDRPPIEPVVTNGRPTFIRDLAAEPRKERSAHYKPIPKDAWTALRQYLFPISGSSSDSDSCKSGYSFLNSSPDFGYQSDCDKPTASVSSQQVDDKKATV